MVLNLPLRKFRDLSILMGEADNFALYRAELAACATSGPFLPFLGDFLTQIAQRQTYLACKQKKKKQKTVKNSPASTRKAETKAVKEKIEKNGIKTNKNGMKTLSPSSVCRSKSETTPRCSPQILARRSQSARTPDSSTRECDSNLESRDLRSQDRPQRRSSSKILRRFYNRQVSHEPVVTLQRDTHSAEMLDMKDNALGETLTHSSSDSFITSSASLCSNSDGVKYHPGNSQKPLLGRCRSESISNTSMNGSTTKRRFSESGKTVEGKRSFFRGFVRRSLSSHSMKEERVSRGTSSEKLPYSKSVNAISCSPIRSAASAEKINKVVRKQSIVDSGALSKMSTQKNGNRHENEVDGKDGETPRNDEEDGQSGKRLFKSLIFKLVH